MDLLEANTFWICDDGDDDAACNRNKDWLSFSQYKSFSLHSPSKSGILCDNGMFFGIIKQANLHSNKNIDNKIIKSTYKLV